MKISKLSKKGNTIADYVVMSISLFLIAIIVPILGIFIFNLQDEINADTEFSDKAKDGINIYADNYEDIYNYGFLGIFIAYIIALALVSYYIDTKAVYVFMFILAYGFILMFGMNLANMHEEIMSDIGTVGDGFPIPYFIMNNWGYFTLAILTMAIILLYAKNE